MQILFLAPRAAPASFSKNKCQSELVWAQKEILRQIVTVFCFVFSDCCISIISSLGTKRIKKNSSQSSLICWSVSDQRGVNRSHPINMERVTQHVNTPHAGSRLAELNTNKYWMGPQTRSNLYGNEDITHVFLGSGDICHEEIWSNNRPQRPTQWRSCCTLLDGKRNNNICAQGVNPFRTAAPFWGRTTYL